MTIVGNKMFWPTLEGGLLIVLGILALLSPLFAGLAVALLFGWLLLLVGILGLTVAFAARAEPHAGWSFASAALALIAGGLLLAFPLMAALSLAILVGAWLLLDGVSLIGLGLQHRKAGVHHGGWVIAAGVFDLLLAVLMFALSAVGSTVMIGFIVGIDLIFAGLALLASLWPKARAAVGVPTGATAAP